MGFSGKNAIIFFCKNRKIFIFIFSPKQFDSLPDIQISNFKPVRQQEDESHDAHSTVNFLTKFYFIKKN